MTSKYKHQIVLKDSSIDYGLGPGVVFERELDISPSTIEMIQSNNPNIVWANIESDVALMLEHLEVRLIPGEN